ncbi:hypothetical protein BJV74DRAFT_103270 [Russula compacta]|nr:hypothetical protein BJV74DRAFT_103270 [Russula compacta]
MNPIHFTQCLSPTSSSCKEPSRRCPVTINALPDDMLIEIFDLYHADATKYFFYASQAWHSLVCVCRRWRHVIFASPRSLDLRLVITESTPVKQMLDVWPSFPIVVTNTFHHNIPKLVCSGGDNLIDALNHHDVVCHVNLRNLGRLWQKLALAAVMQEPFPELTHMELRSDGKMALVLPDAFLGGSAPRLRTLRLDCIPFPALPNLLLSARHLVKLRLWRIPKNGYVSPEAMVVCLSALTSLGSLTIGFQSPRSRPDNDTTNRRPPRLTRAALPALTEFSFYGASEYIDDLAARIDTPLLQCLHLSFFNQLIFDLPRLAQFVGRAENFALLDRSKVVFGRDGVEMIFDSPVGHRELWLSLRVACRELDWQISSMAQLCSLPSRHLCHVDELRIHGHGIHSSGPGIHSSWQSEWHEDLDPTQWLELFHPFIALQSLHVSGNLGELVASALQELRGESTTEVLPALRSLFFEASRCVWKPIEGFLAMRRSSDHPVDFFWDYQ